MDGVRVFRLFPKEEKMGESKGRNLRKAVKFGL